MASRFQLCFRSFFSALSNSWEEVCNYLHTDLHVLKPWLFSLCPQVAACKLTLKMFTLCSFWKAQQGVVGVCFFSSSGQFFPSENSFCMTCLWQKVGCIQIGWYGVQLTLLLSSIRGQEENNKKEILSFCSW